MLAAMSCTVLARRRLGTVTLAFLLLVVPALSVAAGSATVERTDLGPHQFSAAATDGHHIFVWRTTAACTSLVDEYDPAGNLVIHHSLSFAFDSNSSAAAWARGRFYLFSKGVCAGAADVLAYDPNNETVNDTGARTDFGPSPWYDPFPLSAVVLGGDIYALGPLNSSEYSYTPPVPYHLWRYTPGAANATLIGFLPPATSSYDDMGRYLVGVAGPDLAYMVENGGLGNLTLLNLTTLAAKPLAGLMGPDRHLYAAAVTPCAVTAFGWDAAAQDGDTWANGMASYGLLDHALGQWDEATPPTSGRDPFADRDWPASAVALGNDVYLFSAEGHITKVPIPCSAGAVPGPASQAYPAVPVYAGPTVPSAGIVAPPTATVAARWGVDPRPVTKRDGGGTGWHPPAGVPVGVSMWGPAPRLVPPGHGAPALPSTTILPRKARVEAPANVAAAQAGCAARCDTEIVGLLGAGAGLFLAVAYALAMRPRGFGFAMALVSRLREAAVLSHPHRLSIVDSVRTHPGIHVRELQRQTGLGRGNLERHLQVLLASGHVVERRVQQLRCLFPPGRREAGGESALRTPRARQLWESVKYQPGASVAELAREVGCTYRGAAYHLERLHAGGLAMLRRERGAVRAFPV
ncbi:MAG: hypothetical protein ACYDBQ_07050 [Thermoplasmatota archaeon]